MTNVIRNYDIILLRIGRSRPFRLLHRLLTGRECVDTRRQVVSREPRLRTNSGASDLMVISILRVVAAIVGYFAVDVALPIT